MLNHKLFLLTKALGIYQLSVGRIILTRLRYKIKRRGEIGSH